MCCRYRTRQRLRLVLEQHAGMSPFARLGHEMAAYIFAQLIAQSFAAHVQMQFRASSVKPTRGFNVM